MNDPANPQKLVIYDTLCVTMEVMRNQTTETEPHQSTNAIYL